jgi:hypothetical protein
MITENRLKNAEKQLEEKRQQEAGVVVLWGEEPTEEQQRKIDAGAMVIHIVWTCQP